MENDNANRDAIVPKYGPLSAIPIAVFTFIFSQLFAVFTVNFLKYALPKANINIVENILSSPVNSQALFIFLSGVYSVLIIVWFLKNRDISLEKIGLVKPKISAIWQAGLGFVVYLFLFLIFLGVIKLLIPELDLDRQQDIGFKPQDIQNNILLLAFSLVVIPPLVEEFVMRGFLFTGLRNKFNFISTALITSLLFAVAHLPAGVGGLLWVGAIDTFILSIVLCYLREKTGSLWPSITLHAVKNAVALVFLVKFTS